MTTKDKEKRFDDFADGHPIAATLGMLFLGGMLAVVDIVIWAHVGQSPFLIIPGLLILIFVIACFVAIIGIWKK